MKDAVIFRSLCKDQNEYGGRPCNRCLDEHATVFAGGCTKEHSRDVHPFCIVGGAMSGIFSLSSRETTLTYAPPFLCTSWVPSVTLLRPGHSPMGAFETMFKVALPTVWCEYLLTNPGFQP